MKIGNGIIQTGNGIISPISWPPIKNFFYKMFPTFNNEFKNFFWSKFFSTPKIFRPKLLLVQIFFSPQNFSTWKKFWTQNFLQHKKFSTKKFFWPKTFSSPNFFFPKNVMTWKKMFIKRNCQPKLFMTQNSFSIK